MARDHDGLCLRIRSVVARFIIRVQRSSPRVCRQLTARSERHDARGRERSPRHDAGRDDLVS